MTVEHFEALARVRQGLGILAQVCPHHGPRGGSRLNKSRDLVVSGVRGIVVGDVLRHFVARTIAQQIAD